MIGNTGANIRSEAGARGELLTIINFVDVATQERKNLPGMRLHRISGRPSLSPTSSPTDKNSSDSNRHNQCETENHGALGGRSI